MRSLRDYNIDIFSLADGRHEYEYGFDDSFFDLFEDSLVSQGEGTVNLTLDKEINLLKLSFRIQGTIGLICDRSLDPFDQLMDIDRSIILKYGEEDREISEEISMIQWDTQRINVAQLIYEFIGLEIPMKKLHPRYQEETDNDQGELFYRSAPEQDQRKEEEKVDPRWEALKALKNKK